MKTNPFSLEGKVAVITGGAGHIGAAISKGFADAGAVVYALGRNPEKLKKLDEYNSEFTEKRIHTLQLDVSDEKRFRSFLLQVHQEHPKEKFCLVNHASISERQSWSELDTDGWHRGLAGALDHAFTCSSAIYPYMVERQGGVIINTISILSFLAPCFPMHLDLNNAASAHHVAAKGAVLQLTRYLAALGGSKGIRVNGVAPGYFPQKRGPDRPDYMRELAIRIPMSRVGQVPELAPTYVFLASDAASYITGQNLVVDGGYSIW